MLNEIEDPVKEILGMQREGIHQQEGSPISLSLIAVRRPHHVMGRLAPDIGSEIIGRRPIHPNDHIVSIDQGTVTRPE